MSLIQQVDPKNTIEIIKGIANVLQIHYDGPIRIYLEKE